MPGFAPLLARTQRLRPGTSFVDHVVRDVRVGGVGLADVDGVLRFSSDGSGELAKILTGEVAPADSFTFDLKRRG